MRTNLTLKALIILSLVLTLWPAALMAADTRKPNDFERAYTAIALDTLSHELCAKISPMAETQALFNSPGTQIYKERSRCFLYVAVKSLNPYFCHNVVEAKAWLLDGSYFSQKNCERLVTEGQPFNFNLSFDHALILKAMGYSNKDIQIHFPKHPDEPAWLQFYLDALKRRNGNFQQRLSHLPDFSK